MLEVRKGESCSCLSCGKKEISTFKVSINRECNDGTIITFHLCKECMNKLAREFHPYS